MSHEPRTFTNDALGLRVTVVEDGSGTGGSLASAEISAAAGGNGGPPHIHLRQEERFLVHDGLLLVRRRRERLRVPAGEEIRIPPRTPHTFRAEEATSFTAEFRPALRVIRFFRELFALPTDRRGMPRPWDAARLLQNYPDEFLYLPLVPVSIQRLLARPLARLGGRSS